MTKKWKLKRATRESALLEPTPPVQITRAFSAEQLREQRLIRLRMKKLEETK